MDLPGGQTIYLVGPVLAANQRDEFLKPKQSEQVLRVDGCLFEAQTPTRSSAEVRAEGGTITSEVRFAILPVVDNVIPAFTTAGERITLPATALTSRWVIRYGSPVAKVGRDYQMRGDAVLEEDIDGVASHVFAMCERENG
jgi:hypothetical protein